MPSIYRIFLQLLCVFNISLNSTTKKNNAPEISDNMHELLKSVELIKQINSKRGDMSLSPLYKINIPMIPTLATDPEEIAFIAQVGIDIIRVAETALITRQDYIDEHGDTQSRKALQKYKEYCIALQQKGDLKSLFKEMELLHSIVIKNGNQNTFTDYIALAIAEQIYSDPLTTILYIIKYAPLEKSYNELQNLQKQITEQAEQKNIFLATEIKTWLVKQYGFDALEAADDCYSSRQIN